MHTRLFSYLSVAVLALVVLAACGSGAAEEAGQEPEDVATRVVAQGAPPTQPAPAGDEAAPAGEAAAPAGGEAAPAGGAAPAGAGAPLTLAGYDIGWRMGDQDSAEGEIPLTVAPGTVITLPNEGASPHNFAVDALKVDVDMPVGQTVEATIPADAPAGEYEYYCNVPGHKALMKGTLIVDPAAAAAPPAGAAPAAAGAPPAEQAAGAPAGPINLIGYDIGWKYEGVDSAAADITLTVAPGAVVTLPNEGASPHNFAVDALKVDVDMPVGQTVEATIPADAAPGEYEFYCNVPGHKALMKGTLIVQ